MYELALMNTDEIRKLAPEAPVQSMASLKKYGKRFDTISKLPVDIRTVAISQTCQVSSLWHTTQYRCYRMQTYRPTSWCGCLQSMSVGWSVRASMLWGPRTRPNTAPCCHSTTGRCLQMPSHQRSTTCRRGRRSMRIPVVEPEPVLVSG
jgi:hypothetical protein